MKTNERASSSLETLLGSITENRTLLAALIVALVAGSLGSSTVRFVGLPILLGVTVWVILSLRRLKIDFRAPSPGFPIPAQMTGRLVLRTLTHMTQIRMLVRRPGLDQWSK